MIFKTVLLPGHANYISKLKVNCKVNPTDVKSTLQ